jgi:hypothetical protein
LPTQAQADGGVSHGRNLQAEADAATQSAEGAVLPVRWRCWRANISIGYWGYILAPILARYWHDIGGSLLLSLPTFPVSQCPFMSRLSSRVGPQCSGVNSECSSTGPRPPHLLDARAACGWPFFRHGCAPCVFTNRRDPRLSRPNGSVLIRPLSSRRFMAAFNAALETFAVLASRSSANLAGA